MPDFALFRSFRFHTLAFLDFRSFFFRFFASFRATILPREIALTRAHARLFDMRAARCYDAHFMPRRHCAFMLLITCC